MGHYFLDTQYYTKWVITSWTYSTVCMYVEADPGPVYIYDMYCIYTYRCRDCCVMPSVQEGVTHFT